MVMKRKTIRYCAMIVVAVATVLCQSAVADVIIDNGAAGTSYTGIWQVSGAPNPYGANSVWSRNGDTYTWQMSGQPAGTYEVLMWWSPWSTRTTSAAVDIVSSAGTQRVNVNQLLNGGKWNSLGTFEFVGSGSATITAAASSTASTCADAVWFKLLVAHTIPTAIDRKSVV